MSKLGRVPKKFSTKPYILTMDSRPQIDDIDLAAAIAAALQFEPDIPCTITVDVCGGLVTLLGETETSAQRLSAETIASRFAASSEIKNAITIQKKGMRAG